MSSRSPEARLKMQGGGELPSFSQTMLPAAEKLLSPSCACNYCGLPILEATTDNQPRYCCYGCRFAASVTAADGDEGQARMAMLRLGLAVFFSMNVMVFTMLLWSQPQSADPLSAVWYDLARYACLLFTLPVVVLLGGPILEDAAAEIRRGRPSMSLLLCVGIAASLLYSLGSLWTGGHVYFEVAAVILVAVTLGRWFEATGKIKTSAALRGLKQLLPDVVRLVSSEHEELVPASMLAAGDTFRVLPGERIVADGEVVHHSAAVDEQAVTGESLPVVRQSGERVMSGTLVLDGPLDIRAAAPAGEGTLALMIEAVTKATAARTRYERLAEKISRWFLPAVGLIALTTFVLHTWFGDFAEGLLSSLAVLVIACPCALGLATPMALWAAVGRAAQVGVLLRDGDALSLLAGAKSVCFDKTGTLTTGEAVVENLWLSPDTCEGEVLGVAQSLSRSSNHPLSGAVGRYAAARQTTPIAEPQSVFVRAGRGIAGRIESLAATAYLGSRKWLAECGQIMPDNPVSSQIGEDDAAAETLVGWNGQVMGRFSFRETIRPEAEGTIALLQAAGLHGLMLTGDRQSRARVLADSLQLDYRAELLPQSKLAVIRKLHANGPVVMIGDGINDAPALAAADVGIALGSGTDISRHSAGVCLLSNDLLRLPWLVRLARQTERTIRWNLFWAFAYNVAGIGLAAAGLLHPVAAAIAMGISSLLVVTNSLSLARFELDGNVSEAAG